MTARKRDGKPIHTPRYLLRRRIILSALRPLDRGTFLEVGCGRGELLAWLDRLGFTGVGLEISDVVLPLAHAAAAPLAPRIAIAESLDDLKGRQFDYLMSFEVLEHIEDDRGLLSQWLEHLAQDGRFVCTVPAHMKLWSSSDESVGHVRRYERDDLVALLSDVGLDVEKIWVYGYPLVLFTGPLRDLFYRVRGRNRDERSAMDRTLTSSTDSTFGIPGSMRSLARAAIEVLGFVFHYLGLPLRRTDFGDGYLVIAKRQS